MPKASDPAARKLNVLIVDDEASIRRLLPVLFQRAGHSAQVASNGEDALTFVSSTSTHFDVVVTDHDMPILRGDEFVGRLASSGFEGVIFVCSAFLAPDLTSHYLRLGARECFSKPVPWEDLRDRANGIAANSKSR